MFPEKLLLLVGAVENAKECKWQYLYPQGAYN